MEQVYRQKMTVKVMKMPKWSFDFILNFNSFWLGFQIYLSNSLKSFISAPVALID
jgi:hypothetical protein